MNIIPEKLKTIYLLAICGTGMGSLAGLLKERGYAVSGSDGNVYPPMSTELARQGITVYTPFSADNLKNNQPDLVIVGNAVSKTNVEAAFLLESGIPYISMPQGLNHFFLQDKEVIVIAGTHGKTTTTSIMAHLLTEMGLAPSFLIGGVSRNFNKNFSIGNSKYFVIEGDEYDTAFFDKGPKFLHYNPHHVIMTSLEFDHADIYRDLAHVTESFARLAAIIPGDGSLHYNDAYPALQNAVSCALCAMRSYGNKSGECKISNFKTTDDGSRFDIFFHNKKVVSLTSPLSGIYNAENVAACFSVIEHLGLDLSKAALALHSFKGVKRRQEILYQDKNTILIDDFAHHPTAVKETIIAIKNKFPSHHLLAIFEPRSNTSRRAVFQEAYAKSFSLADEVIIAPVNNPQKVVNAKVLDVTQLTQNITAQGIPATCASDISDIVTKAMTCPKKPLCILSMSNGDFGGLNQLLLKTLGMIAN